MPQALLFDLGNVLIDIDFNRACATWAAAAGVDPQVIAARFTQDAAYHAHERGEIDAAEYFAALRQRLQVHHLTDEQMAAGWNAIIVAERPEITRRIAALPAHLPRYVFSNANETHKRHWEAHMPAAVASFKHVFVSSDIGKRKPEPEAFHHVAREIGVAPGQILFFDDLLENVEGARRAGLEAVHVPTVRDLEAALARFA